MTDDIKSKESKNPIETAANKLRESFNKEWQGKLDTKLKDVITAGEVAANATKAFDAAKESLGELVDNFEKAKAEFNGIIKSLA